MENKIENNKDHDYYFEDIDIENLETDAIIDQTYKSELELTTIRQRTPTSPIKWNSLSPTRIIRSIIHRDKFSADNLTIVHPDSDKLEEKKEDHHEDDDKKCTYNDTLKFAMILINHILIQLSLLSILEPLLFFNFIILMEEAMFYEQLDSITDNVQDIISYDDAQSFREQIFYDPLIEFIVHKHQSIDSTYIALQHSDETANEAASEILSSLKHKSFEMALIINLISFVYTLGIKYVYKESIIKMLIHHITLILFIGMFEIWFFTNIASKYFPWSSDEIMFHLFQCFWINFTNKFPEMNRLQHNVTFTCEV